MAGYGNELSSLAPGGQSEDEAPSSPKRRRRSTSSKTDCTLEMTPDARPESPFSPVSTQAPHSCELMAEQEHQISLPKNESFSFGPNVMSSGIYSYPLVPQEQPYLVDSSFYSAYDMPLVQQPMLNSCCPNCNWPWYVVDRTTAIETSEPVVPVAPTPTPQSSSSSTSGGSSRSSTPATVVDSTPAVSMLMGPCKTVAMQQSLLASEAARDPSNHHCPVDRFQPELVRPQFDSPPPKKRKSQDEFKSKRRTQNKTLTVRARQPGSAL